MPITLPALPRRRFLQQSLATACGGLLTKSEQVFASDPITEQAWVLFSDCHIDANSELIARGAKMAENFSRCITEALAWSAKPAGVIVSGDCAYLHGLREDYATFSTLVQPLRKASLPVHLLMGNHDDRTPFAEVLGQDIKKPSPLDHRQVALIETPLANWYLLDSLDKTNGTPGVLGDDQRAWLEKTLDAHADKPAIIVVHHNIVFQANKSALQDSPELLALLRPRKHVKACIYGHTHIWDAKPDESGIHLINLPPTAYVFSNGMPNGWVQATLQSDALKLELRCLDTAHPKHSEVKELKWRA
jgi:3',5'-cyclic AMP phosphodiesterase CpdA